MNYTSEERDLIVLSATGVSPAVIKKLYNNFTRTTPNFEENREYLIKTLSSGVYNEVRENFSSSAYRAEVLENLDKKEIICIPFFSESYPQILREIKNFPPLLYCLGNIGLLHSDSIGIVGSRRTLPLVLKECEKVSKELSERFNIISGAAAGADTAALTGAIESGRCVSVLAYGFDHIRDNLLLKQAVSGLLVTEYPPSVQAKPYQFPLRNRIIAALSKGVLVVSAAEKSGALITAEYAREFGRDIFAFPYSLGVESGAGCNRLIKEGAHLTECAKDILAFYGFEHERETIFLSEEEERVYITIADAGEMLITEIADNLNMPVYKVLPIISSLELKGLAVRLGGNRYSVI